MDKLKSEQTIVCHKYWKHGTVFGQVDFHPGKLKIKLLVRMGKLSSKLRLFLPLGRFLADTSLDFKGRIGILIHTLAKTYILYIPLDSPLVLHLLTSWWPAL